jgi:hypothetical protein
MFEKVVDETDEDENSIIILRNVGGCGICSFFLLLSP